MSYTMTPMVIPVGEDYPTQLPGAIDAGALLVIDVQAGFGDPELMPAWVSDEDKGEVSAAIDRIIDLVEVARRTGLRVIWVGGGGADDLPEWRSLYWLKGLSDDFTGFTITEEGQYSGEFYRALPAAGEQIVSKGRYSAFHGSDIEEVLRGHGVEWIVATGLTTECCVGSTAWDAVQRGFRVIVAGDAAACYRKEVHDAALDALASNVALVVSVDELSAALSDDAVAVSAAPAAP